MSKPRMQSCDCLDLCGDDPRLQVGAVFSCAARLRWLARPRIVGVRRDVDDPRILVVHFSAEPTDDDLRALHNFDRWPSP